MRNTALDPLDGEKVYIGACRLFIAVFGLLPGCDGIRKAHHRAKVGIDLPDAETR